MKASRIIAIVAVAALSTFGMAGPAFAGTGPATRSAAGQVRLAGWELIGWYPTVGACIRAATAYSIATCTPQDGGWVLYAYLND
jgi:hypothetical protein